MSFNISLCCFMYIYDVSAPCFFFLDKTTIPHFIIELFIFLNIIIQNNQEDGDKDHASNNNVLVSSLTMLSL